MNDTATPASNWDPSQYLRHAGHRTRPFLDLLARIPELPATSGVSGAGGASAVGGGGGDTARRPARIADIGCGAGNVTVLLADRWPDAHITGLDTSQEMLEAAVAGYGGPTPAGGLLEFVTGDARTWTPQEPYDLIVSNAALQWVPGHLGSFPAWVEGLAPGGTFAFQVPGNFACPSHLLLDDLRQSPRWRERLGAGAERLAGMIEPAEYLATLEGLGCVADVWETTYLQLLTGEDPVLDWTKGTALRPVLTALADDPEAAADFTREYRDLLREAYPPGPHGTVFPFRRIFAVAHKGS
jgi:trans-aconitate 2-methyltransferase